MVRKLNQAEFINENGKEAYINFCKGVYEDIKSKPEYQHKDPCMFGIAVYDWNFNDGRKGIIAVEYMLEKLERQKLSNNKLIADSFQICSITLSDEDFPDEIIDRYNEFKSYKKEINK